MDVVHPENSSNTCWEGGEIRILSGIHFTRGVFGSDWLRHAGAQPELPALPDPQNQPKKSKSGLGTTQKTLLNAPGPRLSPRGRENNQKPFFGGFGPKKVPKWALILRAAGWDPQSPSKIDWVKYFLPINPVTWIMQPCKYANRLNLTKQ